MLNVFFFLSLDEEILQKDSVPCQYLTYFTLSIEPFVFACGNGATSGEKNKDVIFHEGSAGISTHPEREREKECSLFRERH